MLLAGSTYTRFSRSSAFNTSCVSGSTTPSSPNLHVPILRGISDSGLTGGTASGRTELYNNAACTTSNKVTSRAGPEFKNLSNVVPRFELPAINTVDQQVEDDQHHKIDPKYDEAFQAVKKAACQFRVKLA